MTETPSSQLASNVWSVVALVAGFLLALGLAVAAFVASLCGLFGDECTSGENAWITLFVLGSIGVYLLVPVAVAFVRRQARWLLALVVETALVVGFVLAIDSF